MKASAEQFEDASTDSRIGLCDNSGYSNIEYFPDGQYKSFVPEIDTEWIVLKTVVNLKAGKPVRFHENGNLRECHLNASTYLKFFGVRAKVSNNGPLTFHKNGNIRSLTLSVQPTWQPWSNGNWEYRGKVYRPQTTLEFFEDGSIKTYGHF